MLTVTITEGFATPLEAAAALRRIAWLLESGHPAAGDPAFTVTDDGDGGGPAPAPASESGPQRRTV